MRVALATTGTALREVWANRRSFWFQISIMAANDLSWVAFWILFFGEVGEVRGWDAERMLLLFSILTAAAGLALGLFANARRLGGMAADGELDPVLTLPVRSLPYVLTRRIETVHLGDLFFGVLLFAATGHPTLERVALFVLSVICGTIVLVGFLVAAGALTFFFGGRGEQGELSVGAVLILASYPLDVFGGATKLLLYTAVPAAFITGLPTRLVDDFRLSTAVGLGAAAVIFSALGAGLFALGLRRYSSGSLWTRA